MQPTHLPTESPDASKRTPEEGSVEQLERELMLNPTDEGLRHRYFRLVQRMPVEQALQRVYFANGLRSQALSAQARFRARLALATATAGLLLVCISALPIKETTSHLLRSAGGILLGLLLIAATLWFRWQKKPLRFPEGTLDYYKQPAFYYLALLLGIFFGICLIVGPFIGPR
jgi:hypothetical protein